MTMVTVGDLVGLIGMTPATIRKRCGDVAKEKNPNGPGNIMQSKPAIMACLEMGKKQEKTLEEEKIKLTSAQAEKVELEVEVLKGVLVPADEIEEHLNTIFGAFKARLLSIPTKAAPSVIGIINVLEIEEAIKEYIYEALEELKDYEPTERDRENINKIRKDTRATTETNSKPVVRPKKKTKQRSKRRTRTVEH